MLGLSIPFFNEEAVAAEVLENIIEALNAQDISFYIAAVNNGSTDATGQILNEMAKEHHRVKAIHLDKNAGYGGGILKGIESLPKGKCEWMGWMWGDGQIDPSILPSLIRHLTQSADLAKAYRVKRFDGWKRKGISRIYGSVMIRLGVSSPDVNGCPKLFKTHAFEALNLSSTDWFLDAEALLKAQELGYAIWIG